MFEKNDLIGISDVRFLPVIAAYAAKLRIVEEIDSRIKTRSDVSCGRMVLALILDALCGRSPLFRLKEFLADKDLELLLGEDIPVSKFNDDALGRRLDQLFDCGTNKILAAIALNAVGLFDLDLFVVRHDTTSHSVYGDYDLDEGAGCQPFEINYGFSKAHRPDLKQFIQSLLCVDHGIPIYSKCESGPESDKVINGNILNVIVEKMRELGQDNFVFNTDSAAVTKKNLTLINDPEKGCLFISRLPATYKECARVITEAVEAANWTIFGALATDPSARYRDPANYRGYETIVDLYGVSYRTLVIHSSAHDARRLKRLDRRMEREMGELTKLKKEQEKLRYACLPDAQAAASRITETAYYRPVVQVEERVKYGRGRKRSDGCRTVKEISYSLKISFEPKETAIAKAREEAGCFVLISNVPITGDLGMSSKDLLVTYKEQHIIERNFGFLKDPMIVNSLFLKTPERIEALGLVLVLALMIWRLMERTMRSSLRDTGSQVEGWNKQKTSRPTSFMMTTKFPSVIVVRTAEGRFTGKPLNPLQRHYLKILGLSEMIFVKPIFSSA